MGDGGQKYKFPVIRWKISGDLMYSMVVTVNKAILWILCIVLLNVLTKNKVVIWSDRYIN